MSVFTATLSVWSGSSTLIYIIRNAVKLKTQNFIIRHFLMLLNTIPMYHMSGFSLCITT